MGNPGRSSHSNEDLHGAARAGDLHAVHSICSSNPLAVNSRDKHSRTPLHLAAWSGQTEVVSYLCKHKADIGAAAVDDMSAIHFAAQKGHLEVVRTLLASGVSIKAATRKGMTALHFAVQGSHLEVVKLLVRKGASLSAKNKAGKSPSDLASSEEVRSSLVEFETSSNSGNANVEEKADDSSPMPAAQETQNLDCEQPVYGRDDLENENPKKRVADEVIGEEEATSLEPKKAKIALEHLLGTDDNQEE